MTNKQKQFYKAWWFLHDHKIFIRTFEGLKGYESGDFQGSLLICVAKVNPRNSRIDEIDKLNTKVEVWLECGPWQNMKKILPRSEFTKLTADKKLGGAFTNDTRLACGGETYENAIIKLARLVKVYYGV